MHNHSRYVLLTPLLLDVIATTGCHVLVWGLYLSALLSSEESSRPPTAYIMLLYTATPRCFLCVPMGDTLVHVLERGSYRSTKGKQNRGLYLILQDKYQPYLCLVAKFTFMALLVISLSNFFLIFEQYCATRKQYNIISLHVESAKFFNQQVSHHKKNPHTNLRSQTPKIDDRHRVQIP